VGDVEGAGDARWDVARAVLARLVASASPLAIVRDGLSLLVRQDDVLVRGSVGAM
jgi:hypothetical protein